MDWNKIRNDRAKRQEEVSKQEELIARKKQEILEKLKTKDNSSLLNVKVELPKSINADRSGCRTIKKEVGIHIETERTDELLSAELNSSQATSKKESLPNQPLKIDLSFVNKFKNDGSFLEQFKSLQNNNKEKPRVKVETPGSNDTSSKIDAALNLPYASQTIRKQSNLDTTQGYDRCNQVKSPLNSSKHDPTNTIKNELATLKVNQNKRTIECKQESGKLIQSPGKLQPSRDSSSVGMTSNIEEEIHYAIRLARQESARETSKGSIRELPRPGNSQQKSPESGASQGDELVNYGRMRWSNERTVDATKDPSLCLYAKQVFGTLDLSTDQWKQLEDQRKMKALFEAIQQRFEVQLPQSSSMETSKINQNLGKQKGKQKYAYDSDEEIDPEEGTWEHRKRRKEMEKTKEWAQNLTEMNKGKRHLGDYLPPHELEKFMKKWDAIQSGDLAKFSKSDYDEFKIQCDNLGYKMMLKLGWKEGEGLGSGEIAKTSIKEPIKATSTYSGAGLGSNDPAELKEDDDIYEAYRKRMMLAYRFRPNPLNNPRRPYY